jgi:hypothetical protein
MATLPEKSSVVFPSQGMGAIIVPGVLAGLSGEYSHLEIV